jgi:hypothetical protein
VLVANEDLLVGYLTTLCQTDEMWLYKENDGVKRRLRGDDVSGSNREMMCQAVIERWCVRQW